MSDAWKKWLILFLPLMVVSGLATDAFGLSRTIPVLLGLLAAALIYQRYASGRTWRAILWGDRASEG